ncbi:hypothetical protein G1K75_00985 [Tenacibaculum finnmarkense]|uniref:hypothetical protein n=1 Tax=Tenacibaculum finnmarkense TaxID=2781243 RepID=UPI001E3C73B3|nr:hypothetical protein [Tenacibaculum finnmarkense]MCD8445943.1 hypothetical protein [Tenacibaculum finnmarkense genomovar finnmarkense]MCG8804235.1 hypothetical protein [Tenacibaculum finnmarkense]MCG8856025.1 hypothetical protein [Tenacibaculum finnmarkense]WCC44406.1 hypothetical protein PJW08_11865 [Tenacibaculum finnmarkense]WCC46596.1 hypothetical protein PJH08_09450 [Tenacibaculum finnmarkense]
MKKIGIILTFTFLLFMQSCNIISECEDIDCFTPPDPFQFELVDKLTGENLFTTGKFTSKDIKILNSTTKKPIEFRFIDKNNYNIIEMTSIGWKTAIVNYTIQIADKNIFEVYINSQRKTKGCCEYTEYKEIRIEQAAYELTENSRFYKIFIKTAAVGK